MKRKPAVAGRFYPQDSATLAKEVDALMEPVSGAEKAVGVISPHAGYIYSGKVAGRVFARVRIPETVVILGPNHRGVGEEIAVMTEGTWEMPFGDVAVDEALAEDIIRSSTYAAADIQAHLWEHSLEVQLPFIQKLRPDVMLVPIAFGRVSLQQCVSFGGEMAAAIQAAHRDCLIVASTDMTHYEPDRVARVQDKAVIDEILRLDPEAVYNTVRNRGITMCGVIPVTVMLAAAKHLGATKAELVDYMTSGDTSGDYGSVVGYAGMIIT